jgi:sulfite exporter TauE/SafE
MNLWIIFLTGLFTGGISCMAVQGGLLASVIATQTTQTNSRKKTFLLVIFFLIGKIIAHTLLGMFLGLIGSYMQLTIATRAILMVIASLFMLATAMNLLNVHPIFRFVIIQPPRFLSRFARSQSKQLDWFAPVFVGILTIFIPCGTTQAMMAQALEFGNPMVSASILFAFVLGTVPLFLLFGVFMQAASQMFSKYFAPIAAAFVIMLSIWNLYNAAAIIGLDTKIRAVVRPMYCEIVFCDDLVGVEGIRQAPTSTPHITIYATNYEIDNPYIRAGSTVTVTVTNTNGAGCIQFFTIPQLKIQKIVSVGKEETITFVAPNVPGELPFMCSMGMYRGRFIVQ